MQACNQWLDHGLLYCQRRLERRVYSADMKSQQQQQQHSSVIPLSRLARLAAQARDTGPQSVLPCQGQPLSNARLPMCQHHLKPCLAVKAEPVQHRGMPCAEVPHQRRPSGLQLLPCA